MNTKSRIALSITFILSACGSIDVPTDTYVASSAGATYENVSCSNYTESRNSICLAYAKAEFFANRYSVLVGESYDSSKYFDAVMFISALTAAVGLSWDLHSDYFKVASYTLTSALAAKTYVDPVKKSKLYLKASESMYCIMGTSNLLLNNYNQTNEQVDVDKNIQSMEDGFKELTKHSDTRDELLSLKSKYASDSNKTKKIESIILRAKSAENARELIVAKVDSFRTEMSETKEYIYTLAGKVASSVNKSNLNLKARFIDAAPDMNAILAMVDKTTASIKTDIEKGKEMSSIVNGVGGGALTSGVQTKFDLGALSQYKKDLSDVDYKLELEILKAEIDEVNLVDIRLKALEELLWELNYTYSEILSVKRKYKTVSDSLELCPVLI